MTLTNVTGISLPLAVWLASDNYDFTPGDKSISATALLKPVRQILLKERHTEKSREIPDVSDFIASRLGHSIHDGIEAAWTNNYVKAFKSLGYPDDMIELIRVNPTEVEEGTIPVYLELRGEREFAGYTISGKFDMVLEETLQDFKSTSTFSYTSGSKDEDYRIQGSIYKWIHQDKITADYINIQFIFTDWARYRAKQDPKYPQQRVLEHRVELMSLEETEEWIKGRIDELEAAADLDEVDLPECSEKDLWMQPTRYKYFNNPLKTDGRATRVFDNLAEANKLKAEKGGKGVVITVPGLVKACGYCGGFNLCTQKDRYEHG